jgi:hypothetical protein
MMLSCTAVLTIPIQKHWSGERWFSISGLQGEIVAERANGTRGSERVVSKLELVEKMPGIVMQGSKDLKIRVKSSDEFLIPAKWDGSNFSKVIWGAYITVCTPPKKQEIACREFSVWSQ